jgi:hypothetical protein
MTIVKYLPEQLMTNEQFVEFKNKLAQPAQSIVAADILSATVAWGTL